MRSAHEIDPITLPHRQVYNRLFFIALPRYMQHATNHVLAFDGQPAISLKPKQGVKMEVANTATPRGLRHLSLMTSMLAHKAGISIVWGSNPSTDGKRIHLPRFIDPLSDRDMVYALGGFYHEMAHCRFSDFVFLNSKKAQKSFAEWKDKLFPLLNILEDVWIEERLCKDYPGIYRKLKDSYELLLREGKTYASNGITSKKIAAEVFIHFKLIFEAYGIPELMDYHNKASDYLRNEIGSSCIDKIQSLIDKNRTLCMSTKDNFELALKITQMIYNENEDVEENTGYSDLSKITTEILSNEGVCSIGSAEVDNLTLKQIKSQSNENDNYDPSNSFNEKSKMQHINIRKRLEKLLQTKVCSFDELSSTGSKIVSSNLSKVRFGETRIFKKIDESIGLDTSLCIALDLSGSMFAHKLGSTKKYEAAILACLSLGHALESFRVPFNIVVYGSTAYEAKSFDQSLKKVSSYFDKAKNLGSTATMQAIRASALSLSKTRQRRKMIVHITDGDPSDSETASLAAFLECKKMGIQSAHVFIGRDGVPFENSLYASGFKVNRVYDGSDLAKAMESAIRTAV